MVDDGFQAVAVDYDGTLTQEPRPQASVLAAVREVRAAGRMVVLVTGRILSELRADFAEVDDEFDAIVAENGAVLASDGDTRDLARPVDAELATALAHRDVALRRGRVLVACDAACATVALEEVAQLGLDCQLVRNRDALMILPAGVTKGTGLVEALGDLGVSRHSAIGVGDAENDHPLLEVCELGVAVANAVDSLKGRADVVCDDPDGAGVTALLRDTVLGDAHRITPKRWQLALGTTADGQTVRLPASQINLLITGASGAGKSYVTGLAVEQLVGLGYSLLLIDREGDHLELGHRRGVLVVGGRSDPPGPGQLTQLLANRFSSVVVDVSLLDEPDQRDYLHTVAPAVLAQRTTTGLPHWIVLEEAHSVLASPELVGEILATGPRGYCLTTYQPDALAPAIREHLDYVLAVTGGDHTAGDSVDFLAEVTGTDPQELAARLHTPSSDALLATVGEAGAPLELTFAARATRHVRHWHKYVHGGLPPHLRFYPHGSDHACANLGDLHRSLATLSADTLTFHAHRRDFSRWIAHVVADPDLAALVEQLEAHHDPHHAEPTRHALRNAIEARHLH